MARYIVQKEGMGKYCVWDQQLSRIAEHPDQKHNGLPRSHATYVARALNDQHEKAMAKPKPTPKPVIQLAPKPTPRKAKPEPWHAPEREAIMPAIVKGPLLNEFTMVQLGALVENGHYVNMTEHPVCVTLRHATGTMVEVHPSSLTRCTLVVRVTGKLPLAHRIPERLVATMAEGIAWGLQVGDDLPHTR